MLTSSSPTSRGRVSARVQCSTPLDHARARPPRRANGPTRRPPQAPATVQIGEPVLPTLPYTLSRCLTATHSARHGILATLPTGWPYLPPAGTAEAGHALQRAARLHARELDANEAAVAAAAADLALKRHLSEHAAARHSRSISAAAGMPQSAAHHSMSAVAARTGQPAAAARGWRRPSA